jgi:hypothetical protein
VGAVERFDRVGDRFDLVDRRVNERRTVGIEGLLLFEVGDRRMKFPVLKSGM